MISACHSVEGLVEHRGFCYVAQEAESVPAAIGYFPPFYLIQIPIHGIVLPTFRESLSFLDYPLWKHLHRYIQRYTSVF